MTKPVVVWKERRRGSPVMFKLEPGDRVVGVTGVVTTVRPGRIRVLRDLTLDEENPISLVTGDVIYTLHYLGEGYELFWFKGAKHSDQISAHSADVGSPETGATLWVEALPKVEWWVKVRNLRGQTGWTLVEDDNFDVADMDSCS